MCHYLKELYEIVYGFNPLTHLDLLCIPIDKHASLDDETKAEFVKQLHEKVRQHRKED